MIQYKLSTFEGQTPVGMLTEGSNGKMCFVATNGEWLQLVTAAILRPTQYLYCDNEDINMRRPLTLRELVQWIQRGDIELCG